MKINPSNKKLIKQINESPEPLRTYIHDLESFIGNGAHMIQDLYQKEENIKLLTNLLKQYQYGTCGFCRFDGPITKDPDGLMCDRCWERD